MLLACHKKSYLIRVEFLNYYVIFIAAVSALLAVSVLYVEKNQNKYHVIFENSTIRHIPNSFSYEKPGTYESN